MLIFIAYLKYFDAYRSIPFSHSTKEHNQLDICIEKLLEKFICHRVIACIIMEN